MSCPLRAGRRPFGTHSGLPDKWRSRLGEGVIEGKRYGITQNIGPAARKSIGNNKIAVRDVPKAQRDLTETTRTAEARCEYCQNLFRRALDDVGRDLPSRASSRGSIRDLYIPSVRNESTN
jgi:hypothetical protein